MSTDGNTLQIAITPWQLGNASNLAEQGEIAERLDFHSFWLPENHFGDHRSIPSPLTLLAAVAGRTERIKLGSTSYLLPIRHPLQAAEEVAVLDSISDGRVILGVGRGVEKRMFEAFNIDTRTKRKLFEEKLSIMTRAWRGEPITLDNGETITLAPLPVQRPHPPIWIAAFGPLALKQAGKLGLPYLASPVETLTKLQDNYTTFRDSAREHGQSLQRTTPVMRTLFISDRQATLRSVREGLTAGMNHAMRDEASALDSWSIIGSQSYVAEKIAEYRETLGMTHLIARGRLPGTDTAGQIKSLEMLARLPTG